MADTQSTAQNALFTTTSNNLRYGSREIDPATGQPIAKPSYLVDANGNPISSFGGGTQYTDGASAPAHPVGTELVYNNAGTMTAVSAANPLPTSATAVANQRVNAQSNDFLTGSIVDLTTLLTLAGAPSDANTVASLMGRLTKIRDLLNATLTISGNVTEANSASILSDLATIVTQTSGLATQTTLSAAKTDLDGILTHDAAIDTATAAINTSTANIPAKGQATMANSTPVAIASNQSNVPENLAQVGGAAYALGAATVANSQPVTGAAVQGWIAATGTGTASQEDTLTFANQVRKVVLYNASANAVPFEFDATAAATSFPIQPGQFMVFDDVLCTTVHVFPSATLPINTTSGLYVKGWK